MAKGKLRGITVEIGGDTTKLGKALEGVNKKTRDLQSELKGVESLLKMDPGNVTLLAQKQQILTDAVSETSEKLDILRKASNQVYEQFKNGDIGEDQFRDFQREVIATQNKLEDLSGELASVNSALDLGDTVSEFDKLTQEVAEQESELKLLRDQYTRVVVEQGESSKEAKELRSKMKDLNDELKDNKEKLNKAESAADKYSDALDDAGGAAEGAGDGFTIMGGALADLVSNAIQGAISAIGDLVGALLELDEATREYRTMQAKLEGSANTFGYSADFAKQKYEEFYKYLGDDQASTNAITNLMGVGTSTESLSALVEGASAAWTAYGDSINVESLTESISETIVAGKVTGSFADTINWTKDSNENLKKALGDNKGALAAYNEAIKEGLPVEDAFNEALAKITNEQERADVVAQFLNNTYGESKKTYDELNGSVMDANEAELALKDTQAQLGEAVAPVNTALTDMKNQALQAILPLVEALANAFMDLYNWLKENPVAMTIVTGVVIALATAFGILAAALAIQGLINGVSMAIAFLNTTLLANPITLIVAAIAGLVAAFIYLWNNCDAFRQFWLDLWEGIKTAFSATVEWLKKAAKSIGEFFSEAWKSIKKAWSEAGKFFSDIWSNVKKIFSDVGSWFSKTFTNAVNGVKKAWSNTKAYFSDIWSGVKNTFSSVGSWFSTTFRNAWTAIKNVFSGWGKFWDGLWTKVKNKFSDIGSNIATAIKGSIVSGINGVIRSVEKIINSGIGLINKAIRLANKLPGVNVGELKTLSLPRLAKGAIVDSPMIAEIGEAGREAVIPLENNTGGLAEIARKLSEFMVDTPAIGNDELLTILTRIYERLERLQVVLDSGELVGGILDPMDTALNDKYNKVARGW